MGRQEEVTCGRIGGGGEEDNEVVGAGRDEMEGDRDCSYSE